MAQIKGTNVAAPIVPFDTAEIHPSHEARYGKGGYRTVATITERDAIPAPRREAGMLVFVEADESMWRLAADLAAWEPFTADGGGKVELAFAGGTVDPPILTITQQVQE